MPPWASRAASVASLAAGSPCGLSAEQVNARCGAPTRRLSPCSPWRGPPKACASSPGSGDVGKHDVLMQGRVAEQHVDELAGILPDGVSGKRDRDLEQALLLLLNCLHPSDDLGGNEIVVDRRERHLDALLDRDFSRARFDRFCRAAHEIDGRQPGSHWGHPIWKIAGWCCKGSTGFSCDRSATDLATTRAFSGKVDTGFPQKMRPTKEAGARFRFNLIETRSSLPPAGRARREVCAGSGGG